MPVTTIPERSFVYEFGGFRLDPKQRLLSRIDGAPVVLTGKSFDALLHLVTYAGELVARDALTKVLWPTTIVDDSNLNVAISALRRALKDESPGQRFIATVAGRGYQFVAHVVRAPAIRAASAPSEAIPQAPPAVASDAAGRRGRRLALAAAAGVAVLLVIAAVVATWRTERTPRAVPGPVATLAVLPFKSLTATDRNESLELGMTETLITGLNSGNLTVSPLSSVRRYSGPEQDALAAGRSLGVQAVLEGYIQRDAGQLRVSARLLNVDDGRQLWADLYEQKFSNLFSVQDAIAAKVWAALMPDLIAGTAPALRRYTQDAEAYQLYANGRYHRLQRLSEDGLRQALAYFNQAIERDPRFALAYVGLAETHAILGVFGAVAPHTTFPQARRAVEKALELAPDLGEAYASLGHIKAQYEHDWSGAERAYQRAIQLNPNCAPAWQWLGIYLGLSGRFAEGIDQLRKAQTLDPATPGYSALIGMLLNYQRRYDEAIEQLEKTLEMNPDLPTAHTYLAVAYLRSGRYAEALDHLDRVRSPTPGLAGYRGQVYAFAGRRAEALAEISRLVAQSKERYVSAYDIATIHAALGDADQVFVWLDRALTERSQLIGWLPWDPVFDGIREDVRYGPLVQRLVPHEDQKPLPGAGNDARGRA